MKKERNKEVSRSDVLPFGNIIILKIKSNNKNLKNNKTPNLTGF